MTTEIKKLMLEQLVDSHSCAVTTKLRKLLRKQAENVLFSGEGDEAHDGLFYYTGGLDCLFALIAKAAVADGVSARTVMKMLVSSAFEVLDDPAKKPGEGKGIAALVVHEAQRMYSMSYPSQEEIEELKRDAAAFRASRPH
jgi:hypothetical protein